MHKIEENAVVLGSNIAIILMVIRGLEYDPVQFKDIIFTTLVKYESI